MDPETKRRLKFYNNELTYELQKKKPDTHDIKDIIRVLNKTVRKID